MSYHFVLTTKAEDDLANLDKVSKKRVLKKIVGLSAYEDISHVASALSGDMSQYHRIRVGQYRIVCAIENKMVTILRIQHRREVYR